MWLNFNKRKNETWPEIADNATGHAQEYLAIWPPHTLRKRMAEVKQNENRTTSGLPRTSAVIWSSSWKFSHQFLLVTFYQHLLLALLFIEDYFQSLAHTTPYTEVPNPILHPNKILMRRSRRRKQEIPTAGIAWGKARYDVLFDQFSSPMLIP